MKIIIALNILILIKYIQTIDYNIKTYAELSKTIKKVTAGDSIHLEDGLYLGQIKVIDKSGTPTKPIVLKGSRNAILNGNSTATGRCIHFFNSNHWILDGFTLTNGLQAIMLDNSSNNLINNVYVHHTGIEAVHFRLNSTDNCIQNSTISFTGRTDPGRGEGVYIGQACIYWDGKPDLSNRNKVLYNRFGPNVTAECIDIKEGTQDNLIHGNYFDGTGMSGEHAADSWVDVKGHNNTITNNIGIFSIRDGFQVHDQRYLMTEPNDFAHMFPSGCSNRFENNMCSNLLSKLGKCVQLKSVTACSDNTDINNITI